MDYPYFLLIVFLYGKLKFENFSKNIGGFLYTLRGNRNYPKYKKIRFRKRFTASSEEEYILHCMLRIILHYFGLIVLLQN